MQILDDDGIAAPGEIIRPNDIYINKESPIETSGTVVSSTGQSDRLVVCFLGKMLCRCSTCINIACVYCIVQ